MKLHASNFTFRKTSKKDIKFYRPKDVTHFRYLLAKWCTLNFQALCIQFSRIKSIFELLIIIVNVVCFLFYIMKISAPEGLKLVMVGNWMYPSPGEGWGGLFLSLMGLFNMKMFHFTGRKDLNANINPTDNECYHSRDAVLSWV